MSDWGNRAAPLTIGHVQDFFLMLGAAWFGGVAAYALIFGYGWLAQRYKLWPFQTKRGGR